MSVVLVAVNDSERAFAAARVALQYAALLGLRVHAVTVVETGEPPGRLREAEPGLFARARERAAQAALRHVTWLGEQAGVEVTGVRRHGSVSAEVLAEADEAGAVLIAMASASRPGHALPYVGNQTLRVLEFSTVPVLVVPTHSATADPLRAAADPVGHQVTSPRSTTSEPPSTKIT